MEATVYNRSNCNIFIELKMMPKVGRGGDKNSKEDEKRMSYTQTELASLMKVLNENFQFDMPTGIINAKSKQTISITFKPQLRYEFDIDMVCVARERMDENLKS